MIVFLRYRHVWTRSAPGEWETTYREVNDGADICAVKEMIFEESQETRGHWDGYQGIDIEHIKEPTWDLILAEIERCQGTIARVNRTLDTLEKMMPPIKAGPHLAALGVDAEFVSGPTQYSGVSTALAHTEDANATKREDDNSGLDT